NAVLFNTGTEGIKDTGNSAQADLWMRIDSDDAPAGSPGKMACSFINKAVHFLPEDDPGTVPFEPVIDGAWADTQFTGTYPSVTGTDYGTLGGLTAFCVGHNTDKVSFFKLLMTR